MEDRPDRVGRVLGSEHASTSAFRVVLDDDEYLQLDDLVVVRTEVPKAGEVRTYGVVTEAEAVYEGAAFESDTHRVAELGTMPAAKVDPAKRAECHDLQNIDVRRLLGLVRGERRIRGRLNFQDVQRLSRNQQLAVPRAVEAAPGGRRSCGSPGWSSRAASSGLSL